MQALADLGRPFEGCDPTTGIPPLSCDATRTAATVIWGTACAIGLDSCHLHDGDTHCKDNTCVCTGDKAKPCALNSGSGITASGTCVSLSTFQGHDPAHAALVASRTLALGMAPALNAQCSVDQLRCCPGAEKSACHAQWCPGRSKCLDPGQACYSDAGVIAAAVVGALVVLGGGVGLWVLRRRSGGSGWGRAGASYDDNNPYQFMRS